MAFATASSKPFYCSPSQLLPASFHLQRSCLSHRQLPANIYNSRHVCTYRSWFLPPFHTARPPHFVPLFKRRVTGCVGMTTAKTEERGEPFRPQEEDTVLATGGSPPQVEKLTKNSGESPNLLMLAAGFLLVLITRDAIAVELQRWLLGATGLFLILFGLARSAVIFLVIKLYGLLVFPLILFAWAGLLIKDIYTLIVTTTSVWGTLEAMFLSTVVLSLGETIRSTVVSDQRGTLTLATLAGLGGALGILQPTGFLLLLLFLVGFSLKVQKRDAVSAFTPIVAVLVAVAGSWVRGIILFSFLTLVLYSHWKKPEEQKMLAGKSPKVVQPVVMNVAVMMVGMTIAAHGLYMRHLLWLAR